MLLDHRSDRVDVLGLVSRDFSNFELAIRRFGGAVTTGEVVDDKPEDIGTGNVRNSLLGPRDVRDGVPKQEFSHVVGGIRADTIER